MLNRLFLIICAVGLLIASPVLRADTSDFPPMPNLTQQQLNSSAIFTAVGTVCTGSDCQTQRFSESGSISSIIDKFKGAKIEQYYPNYVDGQSTMSGTIDIRGVQVQARTKFTTMVQNGTTYNVEYLHFCVAGECQDFAQLKGVASGVKNSKQAANSKALVGLSEDIWSQLVDWLKGKGGTDLLKTVADTWVEQTSIDPVAGNPNSFMAEMTAYNFDLANDNIYHAGSGLNLFSVTPTYWNSTNGSYTVKDLTLPLRYSHFFGNRNALYIDMPIDYTEIETAKTYSIALGIGFAHTFIYQPHLIWSLTPSFYAGAVGSIDLGSGTLIYNPAIASRLAIPYDKMTYGLTDDISYLTTAKVRIGDVETPYDFNNVLTQNGVDATYHATRSFNVGGFFRHTNVVAGRKWYIDNYSQIGFKLATVKYYHSSVYDHMTISSSYFFGPHSYKGADVSLGFNF